MALIAKELARLEKFDVTMVVADHGQPHIEKRADVALYSWEGRSIWGIPSRDEQLGDPKNGSKPAESFSARLGRRLNQFRLSLIRSSLTGQVGDYGITPNMISIYSEVDADIYIVPGNSEYSTEVAFYCQQRGKRYVFLAGSDIDYSPEYKLHPEKQDIYGLSYFLKTYAIESADAHIVQNEHQASLLQNGYDRTGTVIKNPIDIDRKFPRHAAKGTLLWVGKSDEVIKRPSLILELARQLPQFKLVMIMPSVNDEIHSKLLGEANELSNVTLLEYVPFKQIESHFASAYLHVNTSTFEGFPNTFLQAAKYGVPTVSLKVDPGGMLSQHHCGVACMDDFDTFKQTVQALMSDDQLHESYSRQSLEYVKKNHD
ncbi:MAG TPA: glycosyltransferase family 4 protein, partial [Anaerolineales bacterium]|nr:glycosyltransferase family 4 protein [Anaerolineales bacterium]